LASNSTQVYQTPALSSKFLEFTHFRSSYFSTVEESNANMRLNAGRDTYPTDEARVFFFDPFPKGGRMDLDDSRVRRSLLWVEGAPTVRYWAPTKLLGERHATVVCIKNPLKIRIVLVSAHLDFCGMECVAHHHCFKGLVLAVGETVSLSLDASPLQSEYDIELRGVDLLLMDVTPSIAQQAAKFISYLTSTP